MKFLVCISNGQKTKTIFMRLKSQYWYSSPLLGGHSWQFLPLLVSIYWGHSWTCDMCLQSLASLSPCPVPSMSKISLFSFCKDKNDCICGDHSGSRQSCFGILKQLNPIHGSVFLTLRNIQGSLIRQWVSLIDYFSAQPIAFQREGFAHPGFRRTPSTQPFWKPILYLCISIRPTPLFLILLATSQDWLFPHLPTPSSCTEGLKQRHLKHCYVFWPCLSLPRSPMLSSGTEKKKRIF